MFDELRDPDPPQPSMGNLQAVTARAKKLRIRRYAVSGAACALLFAAGAGAVVAINGSDGELAPSDPPVTTTIESTLPGTTLPTGSTMPGTTVPATTAMTATTAPTTTVSLASATTAPDITSTSDPAPPVLTALPTTVTPATDATTTSPVPATEAPPTTTTTTTTTPRAAACPGPTSGLLAVRDGEIVKVASDGSVDVIGVYVDPAHSENLRRAMQSDDGAIWLEVDNGESGERAVGTYTTAKAGRQDRFTPLRSGEARLEAVGSLNGESVAAVIDDSNPDNLDTYGTFEIIDVAGNTVVTLPTPNRPNNGVLSVTISTDVIAVAESSDISERLTYYDAGGALLTRYDPNTNGTPDDPADDPIQYGLPPSTINPIQLARGEVAWLEGPEQEFGAERVGDWQLVVADQTTGAERVRVQIGGIEEEFRSADTDGRWLVVNLGDYEEGQLESPPTRSVIIDLSVPEPAPLDVCEGFTDVALTRP